MNAHYQAQKIVARWLAEEIALLSGQTVAQVFQSYNDTFDERVAALPAGVSCWADKPENRELMAEINAVVDSVAARMGGAQ